MNKKYNWELIQADYNSGLTQRDIIEKYGVSIGVLYNAKNRGDITFRSRAEALSLAARKKPRKHSEETKKKISETRKKFLLENPDKVPYRLNHSSKRSIPELIFEKALIDYGFIKDIDFVPEYPMGIYQYDFAFLNQRIDIEIDGGTHQLENVIEIDKRRDQHSHECGWRVLRIKASEIVKDVNASLNKLLEIFNMPLLEIKKVEIKKKLCKCGSEISGTAKNCLACARFLRRKVTRPSYDVLLSELQNNSFLALGKKYGVSDNSIRKWIKKGK